MAADDRRRSMPSVRGGIVKPHAVAKVPPIGKVRAALRRCLENNDFRMVEGVATYFTRGDLPYEYPSMKLLAECFGKMGQDHKERAQWCHARARRLKLNDLTKVKHASKQDSVMIAPPTAGRTERLTPPHTESDILGEADMDVDLKEEEEEEEPLDSVDYAKQLEHIIQRPSLTEEVILSQGKSPTYERFANESRMEMTVRLRLPLTPPPRKKDLGTYLTAQGIARMTRKDTQGGVQAFVNARGRAAKQAIHKLANLCERIEDDAKVKLHESLSDWVNGLRRDEYVDKCYQAFKRARDLIFGSAHDGLYSAKVFLYGSATTGLVLGDSDIDVAVALPLPKGSDNPRDMHAQILSFLQKAMDKKTMTDMDLIAKARVPVLRYYDTDAKIDVDITIANDKSVLLSRVLRTHLKDDVRIWELCMAVKYWARRRRVSGAPQGYINPMGWIIMVIYFLQHHVTPRIGILYRTKGSDHAHAVIKQVPWAMPKGHGRSTAQTGELLLKFFKFFGYDFDFANEAISLNLQYPERVQAVTRREHGGPIFIEQPLDHGVNVVDYVKASNMAVVKTELRRGYALTKTSGERTALFRVRQKSEEDRLFSH